MTDIIIAAEKLSKRYLVGHQSARRERYTTLRDVVGHEARNFARKTTDFLKGRQIIQGDEVEEFRALDDVSFKVKRGEVLGVVGRNGAGKSTLLKVLSRITEPDGGRVVLRGRTASLLEVGTGFHPELTGRENVFLNGAILGMKRAEIRRKFDEIVAFAETERFLDTPVKRYSTGMYVRLAFAVAAHLEPEILIVDEVLAVGDVAFQKKCLQKMQDVASNEGRTVLLVSHNMAAVESMCDSAILLSGGRCVMQGDTAAVTREYLQDLDRVCATPLDARADRVGSGDIRFISMSLEGPGGSSQQAFRCGAEATLHFVVDNRTKQELQGIRAEFRIEDEMGNGVAALDTWLLGLEIAGIRPGRNSLRVVIPKMPLMPGRYRVQIYSTINGTVADWIKDAAAFDVEIGDYFGSGHLPAHNEAMLLFDHRYVVGEDRSVEPIRR
ncbi:MAG TPA: ABC transporter ATP-binding protein [Terracidiphilus sp.]|jgi:lipopolysaccharide transport system ATP-binding protein